MNKPTLFIPGPVEVNEEILKAMAQPMIGHRAPEFSDLYNEIIDGIREFMFTGNHIFLSTSSATGLWEAAVRNIAPKKTLCCVNGAFAQRWYETVLANGFETDLLEVEWGQAITAEMIKTQLDKDNYDMLTLVHNETSTGVASPLQEIGAMMQDYPEIFFTVDAVSSMLGMEIKIDDLGIDLLLASVQKSWALPPGFSICIVSEKVMDRSKNVTNKGYYFDFVAWAKSALKGQTIITPSIMHMYGLQAQIKRIRLEGLENRYARYQSLAEKVRHWAQDHGHSLFSQSPYHSNTVTCIRNDAGWDTNQLANDLLDKGYRFSKGYGKLKPIAFRIPHMGEITDASLSTYLHEIDNLVKSKN